MVPKITRDIIESYLNCKYKAHLKLTRQQGTKSDYELLLAELQSEVRCWAIERISACQQDTSRDLPLNVTTLRHGEPFLLDATLEDDRISLVFDGLKRVDGPPRLGNFHYIPMLFSEGRRIRKIQRLLLDLYSFSLSRLQGRVSSSGIVWHGKECRSTRVRLSPGPRKTERLLDEIIQMANPDSPPKLVLNDHCHVCEFHQHCHDQAVQEDSLSLLRGIGEKEVKGYASRP